MIHLSDKDMKRFTSKIIVDENGILRWNGTKTPDGYGIFSIRSKYISAHRLAYILWGDGELTSDICVLHTIDDRDIVDPRYLFLGTVFDNNRDRDSKGRQARGTNQGTSRLNDDQALEIYERVWDGETLSSLAAEFEVSRTSIQSIKHGVSWGWLTGHKRAA